MEPTQPPRPWCRITVIGPDGEPATQEDLRGRGRPDFGAVDMVAQSALAAARAGGRLLLHDVDPDLLDLLRLAGLADGVDALVVGGSRLGVEVQREAEGGEQPLGVEEG